MVSPTPDRRRGRLRLRLRHPRRPRGGLVDLVGDRGGISGDRPGAESPCPARLDRPARVAPKPASSIPRSGSLGIDEGIAGARRERITEVVPLPHDLHFRRSAHRSARGTYQGGALPTRATPACDLHLCRSSHVGSHGGECIRPPGPGTEACLIGPRSGSVSGRETTGPVARSSGRR